MSTINSFNASYTHTSVTVTTGNKFNINDMKPLEGLQVGGQPDPHAGKTYGMGDEMPCQGTTVQDTLDNMTPLAKLQPRPDLVKIEVNSRTVDHYQYNKVTVGGQSFEYNATNVELVSIKKESSGSYAYAEKPSHGQFLGFGSYNIQTYIDLEKGTISNVAEHFHVSFSGANYAPGRLGNTLEDMAALHEAIRKSISMDCSGEERETKCAALHEHFGQGIDVTASSFADMIGSFLDKTGGAQQHEKVYQSVRALAVSFEAKYSSIMEQNGGRKDIRDALASHDMKSLTAILRELGASYKLEGKKDSEERKDLYSLQELEYAAISVSAYQVSINAIRENGCGSEARQALNVSMFSMKMEVLSARLGVSEEIKEVKQAIEDEANEDLLDAMDENLENRRASAGLEEDAAHLFRSADREMFRAVYSKVMDAFRKTGDALGAIREGALTAKDRMRDAMEYDRPAERWENEMRPGGYWDKFFDRAPYQRSGYQEFANQWNDFIAEISGDKELRTKA